MRFQFTKLTIAFAFAFYLAIAASACQSSPPTPAFPTVPPAPTLGAPLAPTALRSVQNKPGRALGLTGRFVFAPGDGSLVIEDAADGNPRAIFSGKDGVYAESPVLSPDGKQIAFAASAFASDGSLTQDIRVMNADGKNPRVVVPGQAKVLYNFPAFSPDGKTLYLTKAFPVQGVEQNEIDRIDLTVSDGALVKVIDGREANVSPDGKKIVFLRMDPKTFTASLWIANVDGTGEKQLLARGAFAAIFGARFSPDARAVVFAASGPPNQKLPTARAAPDSCALAFAFFCLIERASAHGLPWDLWIVNLDAGTFERLTEIGVDSPAPAWSPDAKFIAFFDATGIYAVDRATKTIYQISNSHGYGGFDWR